MQKKSNLIIFGPKFQGGFLGIFFLCTATLKHSPDWSYTNHQYSVKSALNKSAKSIDSYQPAQSAQTDMSRNFLLSFSNSWYLYALSGVISLLREVRYIEDNQPVIFDMKNISRGCVVRR